MSYTTAERWLVALVLVLSFVLVGFIASQAPEQYPQHHDAVLIRNDIGHPIKCWTLDGEDIFCQEVITP